MDFMSAASLFDQGSRRYPCRGLLGPAEEDLWLFQWLFPHFKQSLSAPTRPPSPPQAFSLLRPRRSHSLLFIFRPPPPPPLCCASPPTAPLNAVLRTPADLWKPDERTAQRKMKKLSKDKAPRPTEAVLRFSYPTLTPGTAQFGFPPLLLEEGRAGVRMTGESRRGKRVMGAQGPDRWVGMNPHPSHLPSIFPSAGRWISCTGHSQVGGGGGLGVWGRGLRGQRGSKHGVFQWIQVVEG